MTDALTPQQTDREAIHVRHADEAAADAFITHERLEGKVSHLGLSIAFAHHAQQARLEERERYQALFNAAHAYFYASSDRTSRLAADALRDQLKGKAI